MLTHYRVKQKDVPRSFLSLSLSRSSFFHARSDSSFARFSTSDFNCSNSSSIFFGKFVASEMRFTASVANLSSTVSASALPRKKASNGLSLLLLLLLLSLSSKLFEFGLEEKIRNVSFLFFSLLPATFARTREEEEEEEEDDDKRRLESATTRFETRATGIFLCARSLFFFKKNEASSSFVVGRVLFLHFDSSSDDDGNGNGNGGREIRFARDDDENDERRLR